MRRGSLPSPMPAYSRKIFPIRKITSRTATAVEIEWTYFDRCRNSGLQNVVVLIEHVARAAGQHIAFSARIEAQRMAQ
jgi:hypothetical protein